MKFSDVPHIDFSDRALQAARRRWLDARHLPQAARAEALNAYLAALEAALLGGLLSVHVTLSFLCDRLSHRLTTRPLPAQFARLVQRRLDPERVLDTDTPAPDNTPTDTPQENPE